MSTKHTKKGPRPPTQRPFSPPYLQKATQKQTWVNNSEDEFIENDKTPRDPPKRGRAVGRDSLAAVPGGKKSKMNHTKNKFLKQLELQTKTDGNQSQKGALSVLEDQPAMVKLSERSKTYQRDGPDSIPASRKSNSAAAAGSTAQGSSRRPVAAKQNTSQAQPIDLTKESDDDDDDDQIDFFALGIQAEKSEPPVPTESFDVSEVFVGRRLFNGGGQKLVLSGSGERAIEIFLEDYDFRSSSGSSGSSSFATSAGDEGGTLHDSSEVSQKNWPLLSLSEVLPLSALEFAFVGTAHKGTKPYVALKLHQSRAKLAHTPMEGAAFRESPPGQKVVLLMLKCEASERDEIKAFTDRVRLALKRVAKITPGAQSFLQDRGYSKKAPSAPTELELLDAFKNDEKIMKLENPTHERKRYYGRIAAESSEELSKQLAAEKRKAERSSRRQKQAAVTPIGHREGDNLTYLVYPVEEEVLDCVTITNGDIRRLESPQWLNDSLIDLCVRVAVHGVVLPPEHSSATSATASIAAAAAATAAAPAAPAAAAAAGEKMEVEKQGGEGGDAIPAEALAQAVLSSASARSAGGGTRVNSIHAFNSLFLTKLREKTTSAEASSFQAQVSKIEKETGTILNCEERLFHCFANNHKRVARWTKNVSVLEKKLLLVPFNENLHWSLAVVLRPDLLLRFAEAQADAAAPAPASASVSGGQSMPVVENALPASDSETQDETQDGDDNVENDEHANIASKRTTTPSNEKVQLNQVERCVFFHLDSMNVHKTLVIHHHIVSYMLHEYLHKHCEGKTHDPRFLRLYAHLHRDHHNSTASPGNRRKAAAKLNGLANLVPILDFKAITPQQENGIDCGVFVVKFAKQVTDNWERLCHLSPDASAEIQIRAVLHDILTIDEFSQQEIDEKRVDILNMLRGVVKPAYDKRKEFEKLRKREEKALAKSAAAAAAAAGNGADPAAPGVSAKAGTAAEGSGPAPASPIGGNSSGIGKRSSKSSSTTGGDDDDDDDSDGGNDPEIVHAGAASASSPTSPSLGVKGGVDKSESEKEEEKETESEMECESDSDEDQTQEQGR